MLGHDLAEIDPLAVERVLTQLLMFLSQASSIVAILIAFAGAVSCTAGVLIERWLFFAEARHVVTLYYGGDER